MAGDIYNSNGNNRSKSAYRGQRDYSVLPRSPSEALEPERAPEPPRGSKQGRQRPVIVFLNRLLTFLLILLPAVAGLFFLIRQQFDRPGPINYPTVFVVAKGEGISTIAHRLEQDGIINSDSLLPGRWIFLIASRRFGVHDKIKAGEFNIKANASVRDILDTLVEGKSILYSISIPEGLTSYQIVERMKASPDLWAILLKFLPKAACSRTLTALPVAPRATSLSIGCRGSRRSSWKDLADPGARPFSHQA